MDKLHILLRGLLPEKGNGNRRIVELVFLLLLSVVAAFGTTAKAQDSQPACNISGSLQSVSGPNGEITVYVAVAKAGTVPHFTYELEDNATGSYISNYGAMVYHPADKTTTQTIQVVPGSSTETIHLRLTVTNGKRSYQCSKSVSIN